MYDENFMAFGEDVVDLYNTPYDAKYSVVCIRQCPFDRENPREAQAKEKNR